MNWLSNRGVWICSGLWAWKLSPSLAWIKCITPLSASPQALDQPVNNPTSFKILWHYTRLKPCKFAETTGLVHCHFQQSNIHRLQVTRIGHPVHCLGTSCEAPRSCHWRRADSVTASAACNAVIMLWILPMQDTECLWLGLCMDHAGKKKTYKINISGQPAGHCMPPEVTMEQSCRTMFMPDRKDVKPLQIITNVWKPQLSLVYQFRAFILNRNKLCLAAEWIEWNQMTFIFTSMFRCPAVGVCVLFSSLLACSMQILWQPEKNCMGSGKMQKYAGSLRESITKRKMTHCLLTRLSHRLRIFTFAEWMCMCVYI